MREARRAVDTPRPRRGLWTKLSQGAGRLVSGGSMSSRKVGPEIAMLLEAGTAESREQVDLILQVSGDAGPEVGSRLEELGATVRTVAGDIITANCPVQNLEAVAELDLVVYVELSRPLHSEDGSIGGDAGPAAPA